MSDRKLRLLVSFLAVLGAARATALPSQIDPAQSRHNVSRWVSAAQKIGTARDTQRVQVAFFLSLKNQPALKALIAAQSDPRSAQYGQYLTPDQFRQRFAPDAKDVATVQRALKQLGFSVESVPASGLYVLASATVSQIRYSLGVSQDLYAYKGKVLRANAETPRLPAALASIVTYVAGLDDTATLRTPHLIHLGDHVALKADSASDASPDAPPPPQEGVNSPFCSTYWNDHSATLSTAPGPYPTKLPWLICGYTPQQVRQAYGANLVSQDGTGVKVAIVDVYASPTILNDANLYSAHHRLPQLTSRNFQQIVPAGIYGVPASDPCGPQGWYGEETLDVESVHSMAPGASIIYAGDSCTDPVNSPLYSLIENHTADIITNSYSYNGESLPADYISSENQFFMQAAAEGISLLFSTGDDGDIAAANGIASGSWDATSPYVTGVGGTSLALLNASGQKQEWGWGNYRAFLNDVTLSSDGKTITTSGAALPFTYYAGAGGGPSLVELAPAYQANVPYSLSGFTTLADGTPVPLEAPHRVTPDISMLGDPYTGFVTGETYAITGDPVLDGGCKPLSAKYEYCEESIGGTSLASPMFAGVLALVDQARFAKHKPAVGFVNPALYHMPVGAAGSKTAPIIDVKAPASPTAVLRGYQNNLTEVRVVTMNSVPSTTDPTNVIEGANTSLLTTSGYDNVTGLGTPNVPAMIQAFLAF